MTWSQHIQSPFPCIEGKSYFFTWQYCLTLFFCHRERCKYTSERMFYVAHWWEGWTRFPFMCSFDAVCRLVLSPVLSWIWTHTKCYWEINSVLGGKSVATALAIARKALSTCSHLGPVLHLPGEPAPFSSPHCRGCSWCCPALLELLGQSELPHSKVSCQAEEPVFPLGLVPFVSVPCECLCSI